ncbi:hypothetical protein BV25DRAFT_1044695 [Artomyces pyxidatus]|uniref:Uncharacterized protein n=1 Tax=Artomyces pyxidatus TaxID=48021 RepID=A0ACB8ST97_9AGAM|nr:hypothetical protein BV25DRAFT_1044695 [Artomyces pyxidatus]
MRLDAATGNMVVIGSAFSCGEGVVLVILRPSIRGIRRPCSYTLVSGYLRSRASARRSTDCTAPTPFSDPDDVQTFYWKFSGQCRGRRSRSDFSLLGTWSRRDMHSWQVTSAGGVVCLRSQVHPWPSISPYFVSHLANTHRRSGSGPTTSGGRNWACIVDNRRRQECAWIYKFSIGTSSTQHALPATVSEAGNGAIIDISANPIHARALPSCLALLHRNNAFLVFRLCSTSLESRSYLGSGVVGLSASDRR